MIFIIKKGKNVNVWIQDFDDAKVESNKVAYKVTSTNKHSKVKHCFKNNSKVKHYFKINLKSSKQNLKNFTGWSVFTSNTLFQPIKALIIDYLSSIWLDIIWIDPMKTFCWKNYKKKLYVLNLLFYKTIYIYIYIYIYIVYLIFNWNLIKGIDFFII